MSEPQLPELLRLRWQMIRSERTRVGLLVLAGIIPGLLAAAVTVGQLVPRAEFDATLLAPAAFLGFAVLSVVSPLATGGGNGLFPAAELLAFPIRPSTDFQAALLLAPLNLAWLAQFSVLFGVISFVTGPRPGLGLALVTTLLYVAVVTVAGQVVAWAVIGIRQRKAGRRLVWAIAASIGLASVAVVLAHLEHAVLDRAPTTAAVDVVLAGADHRYETWVWGTAELVALALGFGWLGVRACAWAQRRPGDGGRHPESRRHRHRFGRRLADGSPLRTLVRTDRASVWRSPPLRRGLLVLTALPTAVAAAAGFDWDSLVLVPALVASGGGLLFGVNLFCLDGAGATWLASLPHPPRLWVVAKTIVLGETVAGACLLATVLGGLRAGGAPTAAQFAAVAGCAVTSAGIVLSTCLQLSLDRPGRAELRGHRDTPAPPAAMAVYSARLASSTTAAGLMFGLAAHERSWLLSSVLCAGLLTLAGVSINRSLRRFDDPHVRARVVAAVSGG